ncbi:hypothetical protein [Paenibacillus tengchongensis]|uniref:hypothetical protein n=1 Tax=Paenibacillus tengchongensis TaxID=2608684 RepID=UPI00124F4140|nr:hypothetical protein [Paenibacillus tengchongensis]
MVNVYHLDTLIDERSWAVKQSYGDFCVFFERVLLDSSISYSKLHFFKQSTGSTSSLCFEEKVDFISETSINSAFFYGRANPEKKAVEIYRFAIDNLTEERVLTIGLTIQLNAVDTRLVAISDRYCVLFLANPDQAGMSYFYSEIFLIDAEERKSYKIADRFSNQADFFLNLSLLEIAGQGEILIFKSGRIQPFEKKEEWRLSKNKRVTESWRIIDLNHFVSNVKGNSNHNSILEQVIPSNETMDILDNGPGCLLLSNEKFDNGLLSVYSIDLNNGHVNKIYELKQKYHSLVSFNGNVYGIVERKNGKAYHSLADQTVYLTENELLLYMDNHWRITFIVSDYRRYNFKVSNLLNNETIEYVSSKYFFDPVKQILLLY